MYIDKKKPSSQAEAGKKDAEGIRSRIGCKFVIDVISIFDLIVALARPSSIFILFSLCLRLVQFALNPYTCSPSLTLFLLDGHMARLSGTPLYRGAQK